MARHRITPDLNATSPGRRRAIKLIAGAVLVQSWPSWIEIVLRAAHAEAGKTVGESASRVEAFGLSPAQLATIEVLTDLILPETEGQGGAKAGKVAPFIDRVIGSLNELPRKKFLEGLAALESRCQKEFSCEFVKTTSGQKQELLLAISKNESKPQEVLEVFFVTLKRMTLIGFLCSEAGIRFSSEWTPNFVEYQGCLHPEHQTLSRSRNGADNAET